MPKYKKLCADLVDALTAHAQPDDDAVGYVAGLLTWARAELAEPEPGVPTDEELMKLAREWNSGYESIELVFIADYARAVLARWGRPAPAPADGEVAELVAWLRSLEDASVWFESGSPEALKLTRAADLLEQRQVGSLPLAPRPRSAGTQS